MLIGDIDRKIPFMEKENDDWCYDFTAQFGQYPNGLQYIESSLYAFSLFELYKMLR